MPRPRTLTSIRAALTLSAMALTLALGAGSARGAFIAFNATLSGDQEVPPVSTNASGSATLLYDDVAKTFDMTMTIQGIDIGNLQNVGPFSSMHLHNAPAGSNGGVIVDLLAPSTGGNLTYNPGTMTMIYTVTGASIGGVGGASAIADNEAALLAQDVYINIHTDQFPAGEIRGQLVPEPSSMILMGLGAAGAGVMVVRRRRAARA